MSLSEFVRAILREKEMTPADVQQKSRGGISGGYVSDILNEKTVNPTVVKLKALALGLGVPEERLFRIARGLPVQPEENPAHASVIEKFERLSTQRQEEVLKLLDFFDAHDQTSAAPVDSGSGPFRDDPDKDNKIKIHRAGGDQ